VLVSTAGGGGVGRGSQAIVVVLARGGGADYTIHAQFQTASQIVRGNLVQVAGTPIGTVDDITLTDGGQADLKLHITKSGWSPLHQGTRAAIRQASLSGVANRYVNLELGPNSNPPLANNSVIPSSQTTSTVDLDQIFNTLDPKTRQALGGVVRGFGDQYKGQGPQANKGWLYLNPSLAASSRLFNELNRDTPTLERFIVSSSSPASSRTSTAPSARSAPRRTRSRGRSTSCRRSCAAPTRPSSTCAPRSTTSSPSSTTPSRSRPSCAGCSPSCVR
jgi:phospholipid/cholesterol/gamma-HCH transport system substrate-binding protein